MRVASPHRMPTAASRPMQNHFRLFWGNLPHALNSDGGQMLSAYDARLFFGSGKIRAGGQEIYTRTITAYSKEPICKLAPRPDGKIYLARAANMQTMLFGGFTGEMLEAEGIDTKAPGVLFSIEMGHRILAEGKHVFRAEIGEGQMPFLGVQYDVDYTCGQRELLCLPDAQAIRPISTIGVVRLNPGNPGVFDLGCSLTPSPGSVSMGAPGFMQFAAFSKGHQEECGARCGPA